MKFNNKSMYIFLIAIVLFMVIYKLMLNDLCVVYTVKQ